MQTAPESLFWYWIAERHAIYLRRKAGQPKPWTKDPILQQFKFTNPFRENDAGTVWLRENFLAPHRNPVHHDDCAAMGFIGGQGLEFIPCDCSAEQINLELLAFNICWYRAFNWKGTGALLGWQTNWNPEAVTNKLRIAQMKGEQIFTGAHIIRGEHGRPKIDSIVDVCTAVWNERKQLVEEIRSHKTLQHAWETMICYPYIGPFQGYEMITDMRHTRLLEDAPDIMTWANAGPGAKRGLERLGMPWETPEEATASMRELLSHAPGSGFAPFADSLDPITYPKFEMRDIEHSLCEFDKYCRVKFGEGRPRSRYPGRPQDEVRA
jgi:hypothetical protein